jgi:DNA polymerase
MAVRLQGLNDFEEWRAKARQLLLAGRPPEGLVWHVAGEENGLFEGGEDMLPQPVAGEVVGSVPPAFLELARAVVCHADPQRFALLYRTLWRLQDDRNLLQARSDSGVQRLEQMCAAVRRDAHKMKAFVRFKSILDDTGLERFAAWFEPDHYVLERVAPFFVRRFTGMLWAVVTPYRSAFWDGEELVFGGSGEKSDVPSEDALEADWKTYFSSIFNPARLKVAMMKSEMPVKYWRNLPEAELVPSLIAGANRREQDMMQGNATEPSVRHQRQMRRRSEIEMEEAIEIGSLAEARVAVQGCRRCPLFEHATQAVFGTGPEHAELMFVGEQPGDQEDLAGLPFVGPAGKLFDATLDRVGIDRRRAYVTNAVKHFKFVPRGKRRLHQSPNGGEISACRFWLELERGLVKPRIIVALGATAAQSILGRAATISSLRGKPIQLDDGSLLVVTVHPSYLLRIRDLEEKAREAHAFEADLRHVRNLLEQPAIPH